MRLRKLTNCSFTTKPQLARIYSIASLPPAMILDSILSATIPPSSLGPFSSRPFGYRSSLCLWLCSTPSRQLCWHLLRCPSSLPRTSLAYRFGWLVLHLKSWQICRRASGKGRRSSSCMTKSLWRGGFSPRGKCKQTFFSSQTSCSATWNLFCFVSQSLKVYTCLSWYCIWSDEIIW